MGIAAACASGDARDSADAFPVHGRVASLIAGQRPYRLLLSGSTGWSSCATDPASALRCTGGSIPPSVAANVGRAIENARGSDAGWAAAVADLASYPAPPRLDAIIEQLVSTSTAHETSAGLFNDLAVAYFVRFSARGDAESGLAALDAIEHAVANDPSSRVAMFNRAIMLEDLHLFHEAEAAWELLAARDASSEWAPEFRQHLATLARGKAQKTFSTTGGDIEGAARADPQGAREFALDSGFTIWTAALASDTGVTHVARIGAALLAQAGDSSVLHIAQDLSTRTPAVVKGVESYLAGARDFGRSSYVDAAASLAAATRLLAGRADAIRDWAAFYEAGTMVFRSEHDAANDQYTGIERNANRRHDLALSARAKWGRALSLARQGRPVESLRDYERAASLFRKIDERTNEGAMLSQGADVLFLMGRDRDAFDMKLRSLAAIDARRDPVIRTGPLMALGRQAIETGFRHAARAILREGVASARTSRRPPDRPEAILRLVQAEFGEGSANRRRTLLDEARAAIAPLSDTIVKPRLEMELLQSEGRSLAAANPRLAATRFEGAAAYFRARRISFSITAPLVEAARLRLQVADTAAAEEHLSEVVSVVEKQAANAKDAATRRQMSVTRRQAFDILTAIHLSRRDTTGAFLLAERARGNPVREVPRVVVGHLVLAYSMLDRDAIAWIVSGRGMRAVRISATAAELRALVRQYTSGIRKGESVVASRKLHALLVEPAAMELAESREVTIIASDELHRLPFAALQDSTGKFLVERISLSFASSVRGAPPVVAPQGSWLLVADPKIDRPRFPDLVQLTGANAEVSAIGAIRPRAVVLVSDSANKPAVLRALQSATAFHFAGHARLIARAPALSHLVLASSGDSVNAPMLTAEEIQRLDLRRLQLVVLSSCGTAQSQSRRASGDNSLSAAFLSAGAGAVVSSLWEADDRGTATLMARFHGELVAGKPVSDALREAQRAAIASGESISRWGAFRVERQ